jgi:AcrR family transcriptional regulator
MRPVPFWTQTRICPFRENGAMAADDRRVARTRAALMSAFTDTVFEKGFENVTVLEVTRRANVGRSTFYQHFAGREDILSACMSRFFSVIAAAAHAPAQPPELQRVLEHLFENRRLTDAIFTGAAREALVRMLSGMIEQNLTGGEMLVHPRLIGLQIAHAQLALIEAWMRGKAHATVPSIATVLHSGSIALREGATNTLSPARPTSRAGS